MAYIVTLLTAVLLLGAHGSIAIGLTPRAAASNASHVQTYPIPGDVPVATIFDVKVRSPGGKWEKVETYRPLHNEINFTTGGTIQHASSLAVFDFNGTVEIQATYLKDRVSDAIVRPQSVFIRPTKSGSTLTFTLTEPRDVVLQVNGNVFETLHIFANFPDTDVPSKDDKGVIYYGPGYHKLSSPIVVGSGETLYLAGGAVVSAPDITVTNSSDVTLRGRGVLYSERGNAMNIRSSKNVLVEGLVGINFFPRTFEAKDITFRRWRGFSAVKWGDGIDLYSSRNILIDSVFLRNSDDCIAIYNHRDESYGDSVNITIQNSILWADVAHPINVGTHGNTKDPETVDGVTIRNIDILDQREKQMLYQGTIALNAGDSNLIQNVLIEDVRVEDIRLGQLLNFRVMYNDKYNTSPGRGIRNVLVRNLRYDGRNAGTSIFTGYDEERTISNVTFENLVVNGLPISDTMQKPGWYFTTDFIPLYANEHVKNLTFKST